MKILFVLPSYEPAWNFGGVVSCMSVLCRALVAEGEDVTVYTTNASGVDTPLSVPTNKVVDVGGVKVWYFKPSLGSKSNYSSKALIRKMAENIRQYDFAYISAVWQWLGVKAANICIMRNVPYLVGTHGSFAYALRQKSYLRKIIFKKLFLDRILKHSTAVHITTPNEKSAATGWLDVCNCIVVPNAVDKNKFKLEGRRDGFRQRHNIPKDAHVIITAGRADWKKRTDLLIKALAISKSWYLIIAGPTDKENKTAEWRALANQYKVSNRVVWTGFLSNADLLQAYSSADLFALVSENENFGMVVVEAMLCGLPVLVSKEVDVWCFLDKDNVGICVEKKHELIAAALNQFSVLEKRLKDSAQIREVAVRKFSPDVIAQQFIREIMSVIHCANASISNIIGER